MTWFILEGYWSLQYITMLPWWLSGKESACQCRTHRFNPWVGKISWRRKWQPTPVFLPGKSHGWWNLAGYSPWSCKELDMTEQLHFHSLEGYDQPRQHIKKQRHYFATQVHLVKAMVFPVVMYGCESWSIKKAEHQRIDVFELWYWRLLRVPWTARRCQS